jgi:hypothetical protein
MSLTVAVPQGDPSEAEANQVGKEKTISSYGLSATVYTRIYREKPATATTSVPQACLPATTRPSGVPQGRV